MNTHCHQIQVMLICGGLRHNPLYIKAHADITGRLMTEKGIYSMYVCMCSTIFDVETFQYFVGKDQREGLRKFRG